VVTSDRRAVCGRTARTVRREGRPKPSLPLSPIILTARRRLRAPASDGARSVRHSWGGECAERSTNGAQQIRVTEWLLQYHRIRSLRSEVLDIAADRDMLN
jgi:hypothetical protein